MCQTDFWLEVGFINLFIYSFIYLFFAFLGKFVVVQLRFLFYGHAYSAHEFADQTGMYGHTPGACKWARCLRTRFEVQEFIILYQFYKTTRTATNDMDITYLVCFIHRIFSHAAPYFPLEQGSWKQSVGGTQPKSLPVSPYILNMDNDQTKSRCHSFVLRRIVTTDRNRHQCRHRERH